MRHICFACAIVLASASMGWAQPAMPKPGPEFQRMAYFVGTWNFSGEAKAGPMGPGGAVTMTETCEMMDGGFAIVCRSQGKGPTGPTRATSIMTYDPAKKVYTYTAAESGMPVFTALGTMNAGTWTWTTESNMGGQAMRTKVTVKEGGPTSYDFTMEMAAGSGAFAPMIQGKVTKK
jgi:hypothetical protein